MTLDVVVIFPLKIRIEDSTFGDQSLIPILFRIGNGYKLITNYFIIKFLLINCESTLFFLCPWRVSQDLEYTIRNGLLSNSNLSEFPTIWSSDESILVIATSLKNLFCTNLQIIMKIELYLDFLWKIKSVSHKIYTKNNKIKCIIVSGTIFYTLLEFTLFLSCIQ